MERPRAMVLAAGLGTRLGPLSDERPKPLLPMCDVPLLYYGLSLLAGHGFREAAVNLHHLGHLIEAELAARPVEGLAITFSREEQILGTGGGLKKMADWLTRGGTAPFVVMNGKLVVDVDLDALLARHRDSGALATMVVREVPDAARWGAIDLDDSDRVVRILDKGPDGSERRVARRTMFCGVHVVSPALLARVPPEGEQCIIRQGYLPALLEGERIAALRYDGYFQEHSTPARYLEGNFALLSGEGPLRHPPAPLTGIDPTARVHASAKLVAPFRIGPRAVVDAGATVGPCTVVGRDARVAADAEIAESVVWRGATASGRLVRAIVTPRAVLPVPPDGAAP